MKINYEDFDVLASEIITVIWCHINFQILFHREFKGTLIITSKSQVGNNNKPCTLGVHALSLCRSNVIDTGFTISRWVTLKFKIFDLFLKVYSIKSRTLNTHILKLDAHFTRKHHVIVTNTAFYWNWLALTWIRSIDIYHFLRYSFSISQL